MRITALPLLFFILTFFQSSAQITKKPLPDWVHEIFVENQEIVGNNAAFQYLLIDSQDHLAQQTVFRHFAIKVLNSEGVQALSDIDVSYDPSYQKLSFHKIQLIRNGQTIEKMATSNMRTIQRETGMERSLYDGALSAIINLADVSNGDIIEYAYSIKGFNPINNGHYANTFYQQYTSPVNKIYSRVLSASDKKLRYKLLQGAKEPTVEKGNGTLEYSWDIDGLDFVHYDSNTPIWYDIQKQVSLTTYENWNEVVNWALPLYETQSKDLRSDLALDGADSEEARLLKTIRLVQDDIRYLGFESGIGAYKPNPPAKVVRQKYGDCKDKSLLLVTLLRNQGISAFPVLVNTRLGDRITSELPSHGIFDHCIVNFEFKGETYFVDPTLTNQGGDLEHMALPDYKAGLLIKKEETELVPIINDRVPELNITETFSVDAIGGNAVLLVESKYTGSKADQMRSYFGSTAKDVVKREFLNYYSNLYPQIEMTDDVRFTDASRDTENMITIEEYYTVPKFWIDSDDNVLKYCQLYPLILEGEINYPQSAKRVMPYYLGTPHKFSQTTTVDLPEDWPIEPGQTHIEGNGFSYTNKTRSLGRTVVVNHNYDLNKEVIEGSDLTEFQQKHEKIQEALTYYLTYDSSLSTFKMSWVSIVLALLALGLGVYGAYLLYTRYNPEPFKAATNLNIGGWLVLPAIGLCLTPFIVLYGLADSDFFNHNSWIMLTRADTENAIGLGILIGFEIIYNVLFLIFSILIVVLFFQRRTSLPLLVSIFYGINLLFPLLDTYFVSQLVSGQAGLEDPAVIKELTRGFVAALIWIPYFNMSQRVKDTFSKTYAATDTDMEMEIAPKAV